MKKDGGVYLESSKLVETDNTMMVVATEWVEFDLLAG